MKQITLNLLLSIFLVEAIYNGNASASRLLREDHAFSISHATASPAAFDLKLNFVIDGSGSQRPVLHSNVAIFNCRGDGFRNALGANDVARNAETTEISFQGNDIHRRTSRSSLSGYNNNIAEELVFNGVSKGPSHKGYATIIEQRLSASKPSHVAYMQIRHARTRNTMLRSKRKHGSGHMRERSQRILSSSPSPGDGN